MVGGNSIAVGSGKHRHHFVAKFKWKAVQLDTPLLKKKNKQKSFSSRCRLFYCSELKFSSLSYTIVVD